MSLLQNVVLATPCTCVCFNVTDQCFFLAIPLSVFQNLCLGTKQTQEKTSKKCLLFQRRKIKQNEPNFLNWGGDAAILAANSFEYSSDPWIYLAISKPAITQDKKQSGFHSCLLFLPTCKRWLKDFYLALKITSFGPAEEKSIAVFHPVLRIFLGFFNKWVIGQGPWHTIVTDAGMGWWGPEFGGKWVFLK